MSLDRAKDFAPPGAGQRHLGISKDLARAFVTEVEAAPEEVAGAIWAGFLRGLAAKAGGAPVHVHQVGRA